MMELRNWAESCSLRAPACPRSAGTRCAPGAGPGGRLRGVSRAKPRLLCCCRQSERRGAAGNRRGECAFARFACAQTRFWFFSGSFRSRFQTLLAPIRMTTFTFTPPPLLLLFTVTRAQMENTSSQRHFKTHLVLLINPFNEKTKSWFLNAHFTAAFPGRGCAKTHNHSWSSSRQLI